MNPFIKKALSSDKVQWTNIEQRIVRYMFAGRIVNLIGKPGIGKTQIFNHVQRKLKVVFGEFNLISVPLPQYDETDIGGLPKGAIYKNVEVFKHLKPEWAVMANEVPTLVLFDEANRSKQDTLNAMMKLLRERCIDYDFRFNENVYFALAGNLGEDDGTIVNEFDSALKGRLVTIPYNPSLGEWVEDFAAENVSPEIIKFINTSPSYYYKYDEEANAYPSPRSWTDLDIYLKANLEKVTAKTMLELQSEFSAIVGGEAAGEFVNYLYLNIETEPIEFLINFEENNDKIKNMSRSERIGLMNELISLDTATLVKHNDSFLKLLAMIDADQTREITKQLMIKVTSEHEDLGMSVSDVSDFMDKSVEIIKRYREDHCTNA
jgi:MoxR-like ATPase